MLASSSSWARASSGDFGAPGAGNNNAATGAAAAQQMRRVLTPLKCQQPTVGTAGMKAPLGGGTLPAASAAAGAPSADPIAAPARAPRPEQDDLIDGSSSHDPTLLRAVPSFAGRERSEAAGLVSVNSALLEPLERPARPAGRAGSDFPGGDGGEHQRPSGAGGGRARSGAKKSRVSRAELHHEIDALWFAVSLMAPRVGRQTLEDIRSRVPVDVARWDAMVRFTCGGDSDDEDDASGDERGSRARSTTVPSASRRNGRGGSVESLDVAAEFLGVQDAIAAAAAEEDAQDADARAAAQCSALLGAVSSSASDDDILGRGCIRAAQPMRSVRLASPTRHSTAASAALVHRHPAMAVAGNNNASAAELFGRFQQRPVGADDGSPVPLPPERSDLALAVESTPQTAPPLPFTPPTRDGKACPAEVAAPRLRVPCSVAEAGGASPAPMAGTAIPATPSPAAATRRFARGGV